MLGNSDRLDVLSVTFSQEAKQLVEDAKMTASFSSSPPALACFPHVHLLQRLAAGSVQVSPQQPGPPVADAGSASVSQLLLTKQVISNLFPFPQAAAEGSPNAWLLGWAFSIFSSPWTGSGLFLHPHFRPLTGPPFLPASWSL